jgi:hypothetical protein
LNFEYAAALTAHESTLKIKHSSFPALPLPSAIRRLPRFAENFGNLREFRNRVAGPSHLGTGSCNRTAKGESRMKIIDIAEVAPTCHSNVKLVETAEVAPTCHSNVKLVESAETAPTCH